MTIMFLSLLLIAGCDIGVKLSKNADCAVLNLTFYLVEVSFTSVKKFQSICKCTCADLFT